jgi:thioredoxin reductase
VRRAATVTSIEAGAAARWRLALDDGSTVETDRILLATGMRYAVPDIDGITEFWGASVFHCPFCHGWEHRDQSLAVVGGPMMATERSLLMHRWSDDVTLVAHGAELTDNERGRLHDAGVVVRDADVVAAVGQGRELRGLHLSDGTLLPVTGALIPAPHEHRDPALVAALGVETLPSGHVRVDQLARTTVDGVWAAGDVTSQMASVARSIGEGSVAAASITHDLVVSEASVSRRATSTSGPA